MITVCFTDSKMLKYAKGQHQNFTERGLAHRIYEFPDMEYGMELFIKRIDMTIECLHEYPKSMKLDAEVRLHSDIPVEWEQNENVLFFKVPDQVKINLGNYTPVNTGQMIVSRSAIPWLTTLRNMLSALIPENTTYEGTMCDEQLLWSAMRVSPISYYADTIQYIRSDSTIDRCNRGGWVTPHTVLTHPCVHNWNMPDHHSTSNMILRNHFDGPLWLADAIILGLRRSAPSIYWNGIGNQVDEITYEIGNWLIRPSTNEVAPKDFLRNFKIMG